MGNWAWHGDERCNGFIFGTLAGLGFSKAGPDCPC
jgi:hypothetical protein